MRCALVGLILSACTFREQHALEEYRGPTFDEKLLAFVQECSQPHGRIAGPVPCREHRGQHTWIPTPRVSSWTNAAYVTSSGALLHVRSAHRSDVVGCFPNPTYVHTFGLDPACQLSDVDPSETQLGDPCEYAETILRQRGIVPR